MGLNYVLYTLESGTEHSLAPSEVVYVTLGKKKGEVLAENCSFKGIPFILHVQGSKLKISAIKPIFFLQHLIVVMALRYRLNEMYCILSKVRR